MVTPTGSGSANMSRQLRLSSPLYAPMLLGKSLHTEVRPTKSPLLQRGSAARNIFFHLLDADEKLDIPTTNILYTPSALALRPYFRPN